MEKHGTKLAAVAIPDGFRRWLRERMSVTTAEELAFLVVHHAERFKHVLSRCGTDASAVERALRNALSPDDFRKSTTAVAADEFVNGVEPPNDEGHEQ